MKRRPICHKYFGQRHPLADKIADDLMAHREMIQLSAGLVVRDIMEKYGCSERIAYTAIGHARRLTLAASSVH
jgi:hypothetical protein